MSSYDPALHAQATEASATADKAADFLFVTRKWAPAMGGMETWSLKLTEHLRAIQPIDLVALPGRTNGMPPSIAALLLFPLAVLRRYFSRAAAPRTLLLGDMAIWPLGLLAMLRGSDTKILIAAHGTDVSYHRRGGIKGTLYGMYLRLGARSLKRATLIANSRATAAVAAETGWGKAVVIPLGTEPREALSNGKHNGNILFAGRLVHRKGCGWFTREVLPHLPTSIRLQVAGTGWDDSEAHVVNNPRVDYLGCLGQTELAHAYANALCVIVPNIDPENGEYEGFGLVAPEAASVGGIVLAADHGGLRDAVIDGETGHLIATGNAREWISAISQITDWSNAKRLAAQQTARRKAKEFYTWDRVAAAIADAAASNRSAIQREATAPVYPSENSE